MQKIWKFLNALVPKSLPQTKDSLEAYCSDVICLGGFEDSEHMRVAIASELLQLDVRRHTVPMWHFVARMKRVKSNATAYDFVAAFRDKAKKAAEAEKRQDAANEILPNQSV